MDHFWQSTEVAESAGASHPPPASLARAGACSSSSSRSTHSRTTRMATHTTSSIACNIVQDVEEILGIATMLENKGKFQKAANLLYGCIVADYHNDELRKRWDDLIQKANRQEAGELACLSSVPVPKRRARNCEPGTPISACRHCTSDEEAAWEALLLAIPMMRQNRPTHAMTLFSSPCRLQSCRKGCVTTRCLQKSVHSSEQTPSQQQCCQARNGGTT